MPPVAVSRDTQSPWPSIWSITVQRSAAPTRIPSSAQSRLSKNDVTRRRAPNLIFPRNPPPSFAPATHYPLRHAHLPMASEKRARTSSMDDSMDQDSPAPEDTPSSNPHDSGATPLSTTQTTGASTASASNPSANTPATAGTAQTADTSSSAGTPNAPPPTSLSTAASKRRRGLGVVTPNACTECRKKRAKVPLHCSHSRPSRTFPQCDPTVRAAQVS